VYLPGDWLAQAGVPRDAVAAPEHREAVAAVVARLLDAAEPYYASAQVGVRALPPRCAWAIGTALRTYRSIGHPRARARPARLGRARVHVRRGEARPRARGASARAARPSRPSRARTGRRRPRRAVHAALLSVTPAMARIGGSRRRSPDTSIRCGRSPASSSARGHELVLVQQPDAARAWRGDGLGFVPIGARTHPRRARSRRPSRGWPCRRGADCGRCCATSRLPPRW
jgi:hypothetical protein